MSIQEVSNAWIYMDRNTEVWQGHVPASQGVFQPIHWVTLGRMRAEMQLVPNEGRIADVGCGSGLVSVNLAWKKPRTEVIGIDPDDSRMLIGRQLVTEHHIPNCRFEVGSIENHAIEKESCACVLCTEVLDHIPDVKPQLEDHVERLIELLMPGGRLILSFLDQECMEESGVSVSSPLVLDDFSFITRPMLDRNCPRWWYLFYVDKE